MVQPPKDSLCFLYEYIDTFGQGASGRDVQRRLEDKIRWLCLLAMAAKDDDAWLILSELRILLRQHVEHLRMVAAGKLSGAREFIERRSDRKPA